MRPHLEVAAALLLAAMPASGGELEDLADRHLQAGNVDLAIRYYRKAIAGDLVKPALWEKYDLAIRTKFAPPPQAAPPVSQPAPPPATAAAPVDAPPPPPPPVAPTPVATAVPTLALPPADVPSGMVTYRPAERVPLPDPGLPGSDAPAAIEGGRYRVDSIVVAHDSRGGVRVRGKLTNTGETFFNYPRVYVSIFDRADGLRGRLSANLERGKTSLAPGETGEFEVGFPTYTGPVGSYNVEVTGSQ